MFLSNALRPKADYCAHFISEETRELQAKKRGSKKSKGWELSAVILKKDKGATKQPPAKAGGFELRTESPDTRRLNDAS